jgi:ABC-type branched-subunit amino acid transport system substrate-binding protein
MKLSIAYLAAGVAAGAIAVGSAWAAEQAPAPVVGPQGAIASPAQGGMDAAIGALRRNQWAKAVELYRPLVNASNAAQRGQARYGLAVALAEMGMEAEAFSAMEGTLDDGTPLGKAVTRLRGQLLLQLADKALAEKGPGAAASYLAQYERLPEPVDMARHDRIKAAGEILASDPTNPTMVLRVGVMLPMNGELKDVGEAVMRGLQLGLHDFDGRRGTRVELLPMDVHDEASAASAASALAGQQVNVVVGPLLSKDVVKAAETLGPLKIPMLALTSDRSVLGSGVYALNYLPAEQARLIAQWAVSNGHSAMAGLAPANPYGYEVIDAFQDEAKRLGATVTGTSFYDPKATDIGQNIRTLVGNGPSPTVTFDGLFLPAQPSSLPLIVAQLSYYDVDKAGVQLLGAATWQNNALLSPNARNVRGGLFATPPRAEAFNESFQSTYGTAAHPLAVLGYDAGRVLTDIAGEKQRTGNDVAALLLRPEGFYGSGGYLRFTASGVTQRGLDVVKVGEQFEVLKPALSLAPIPVPADLQPQGASGAWGKWW